MPIIREEASARDFATRGYQSDIARAYRVRCAARYFRSRMNHRIPYRPVAIRAHAEVIVGWQSLQHPKPFQLVAIRPVPLT
jgi:hypothetical protein